jgi:hypothetical protein
LRLQRKHIEAQNAVGLFANTKSRATFLIAVTRIANTQKEPSRGFNFYAFSDERMVVRYGSK